MDQPTKPKDSAQGDNANASGTYPANPSNLPDMLRANVAAKAAHITNDPRAPYAADPLNAGIPTSQADIEPDDILELELGGTGTIIVAGILTDADYNPDLTGVKRIEVYDKMRKGDATVKLGLSAVKKPLLAAEWFIKPGEGEDDTGEKTIFVRDELLHNPNFSFTQFLRQALLYCDYGNSIFEKVFRRRADKRIGWKKFAPRLPKTVYRYTLEDGVTPGITQYLPTGGIVQIPQWKLMMFVLDMEGANYEGESMLRACYMHWYYKDLYYRIDAIASERQGMGVPIIRVPAQATPEDKRRAKIVARNIRVNQEAYVDLPEGFTLEYIDTKAKELKEVKEMIMHHDRQILKAFAAHFLDMGASSAGSRNLSKDQSDLYKVSELYIARIFQEIVQLAIKELVDLNWSGLNDKQYPTLEHGQIGEVDFTTLADALGTLSEKGIIIPDKPLETYARKTMQLPAADENPDEKDQQLRKVGFPPPPPMLPGGPGKPAIPGKPVAKKPSRFAEDLLQLSEDLEEIIAQREQEADE